MTWEYNEQVVTIIGKTKINASLPAAISRGRFVAAGPAAGARHRRARLVATL